MRRPHGSARLLTRGDVCHVHADRAAAKRCGVLLGGAPELVRHDEDRSAVYRVAWSLSSAVEGRGLRHRGDPAGAGPLCRAADALACPAGNVEWVNAEPWTEDERGGASMGSRPAR